MLTIAAVSATLLLFLAALVALGLTGASDLGWTLAFQSIASGPLDLVANADTVVGQLSVTLALAAVLAVVAWRHLGGWAWLGVALVLATGAVELLLKFALRHPGPPAEFVRAFHNVLGVRVESPSSFPSGHLARVTFLAVVLAGMWPRTRTWLAVTGLVAATVFLRVYIGDHWISDALAGAALGTAAGSAALAWMRATAARR